jgi:hypothetical protein
MRKDLRLVTEESAAAEREQCCRDVCTLCAEGHAVERMNNSDWRHFDDRRIGLLCTALAIRERAYQQEQDDAAS